MLVKHIISLTTKKQEQEYRARPEEMSFKLFFFLVVSFILCSYFGNVCRVYLFYFVMEIYDQITDTLNTGLACSSWLIQTKNLVVSFL